MTGASSRRRFHGLSQIPQTVRSWLSAATVRHPAFAPISILLISLAIRIPWALAAHVTPFADSRGYDRQAMKLLSGEHFGTLLHDAYRTPGYSLFLAGLYHCFGHSLKAAAVAQAILGGITSALVFMLAARVVSRRAASAAGMLHALSPEAIAYVPLLWTETLATFLTISGLTLLTHIRRGSMLSDHRFIAAGGMVLGLSVLVRPAAVLLLPGCLLAVLVVRGAAWRRRVTAVFLVVAAAALTLTPWFVRNYRLGLGPVALSTSGGVNLLMGNNDLATRGGTCPLAQIRRADYASESEWNSGCTQAALKWIRANPGRYARLCLVRLWRIVGPEPADLVAAYLVPSAANDAIISGAWFSRRAGHRDSDLIRRSEELKRTRGRPLRLLRMLVVPLSLLALLMALPRWRQFSPVLLPWGSYVLGISLTFAMNRFRVPVEPLLYVPLGALIAGIFFRTHDFAWPRERISLACLAVAAILVFALLDGYGATKGLYVVPLKEAPTPNVTGYRFTRVSFAGRPERFKSRYRSRAKEVRVTASGEGLRCDVVAPPDPRGGHYGGVTFPASGADALRLDIEFLKPDNISAAVIIGRGETGRVATWKWSLRPEQPPSGRRSYVLVRGQPTGYFKWTQGSEEPPQIVEVLIAVRPGREAGFILHGAEVGHAPEPIGATSAEVAIGPSSR